MQPSCIHWRTVVGIVAEGNYVLIYSIVTNVCTLNINLILNILNWSYRGPFYIPVRNDWHGEVGDDQLQDNVKAHQQASGKNELVQASQVGHLHRVWMWCIQSRGDRDMTRVDFKADLGDLRCYDVLECHQGQEQAAVPSHLSNEECKSSRPALNIAHMLRRSTPLCCSPPEEQARCRALGSWLRASPQRCEKGSTWGCGRRARQGTGLCSGSDYPGCRCSVSSRHNRGFQMIAIYRWTYREGDNGANCQTYVRSIPAVSPVKLRTDRAFYEDAMIS